jgi:hypothetical protein
MKSDRDLGAPWNNSIRRAGILEKSSKIVALGMLAGMVVTGVYRDNLSSINETLHLSLTLGEASLGMLGVFIGKTAEIYKNIQSQNRDNYVYARKNNRAIWYGP